MAPVGAVRVGKGKGYSHVRAAMQAQANIGLPKGCEVEYGIAGSAWFIDSDPLKQ